MKQLASLMEKAVKVMGLERANVRQNTEKGMDHGVEKGKIKTERIETKDNTNIQYAQKGLGEHTTVTVKQEETAEGLKVDNKQDAEAALKNAKNDYLNKTAYDMDKDGDLKVSKSDTKEATSSISDLPIIGGFSEQNPGSELRPSDVDSPVQNNRSKGGSR